MNGPIDIVISYVDVTNKEWQDLFIKTANEELTAGKNDLENRQAFGVERFREWGGLKYWFRGVEKSCPWVHKIFLVLQNKSQIPAWLNINNPKLRIVYHDEFMPKELLPSFNGLAIDLFYSNIKDLSNNFISADDDYYFLNSIPQDWFFKENIPCLFTRELDSKELKKTDTWSKICNNTTTVITDLYKPSKLYQDTHLPLVRSKKFEHNFLANNYNRIVSSINKSKFRTADNIYSWVYVHAMLQEKKYINKNIYSNSISTSLVNLGNKQFIDTYFLSGSFPQMCCLNDDELVTSTNYANLQRNFSILFSNLFPTKSSFEL